MKREVDKNKVAKFMPEIKRLLAKGVPLKHIYEKSKIKNYCSYTWLYSFLNYYNFDKKRIKEQFVKHFNEICILLSIDIKYKTIAQIYFKEYKLSHQYFVFLVKESGADKVAAELKENRNHGIISSNITGPY